MGTYDIAQICFNGHVITDMASKSGMVAKYCDKCGEETTTKCDKCSANIRGYYDVPGVLDFSHKYRRPSYCHNCGHSYPWTLRLKEASSELIDLADQLNATEKEDLKISIDNLLVDTPKTRIAEVKFKKYISKAGSEIAKGIKDILIDVVSETVKKTIWPS